MPSQQKPPAALAAVGRALPAEPGGSTGGGREGHVTVSSLAWAHWGKTWTCWGNSSKGP